MAETYLGKVIHYYDKIMVAVVKLEADLGLGETIHFTGKGSDFTQSVASLQLDHQTVTQAKAGSEIAIKVDQEVKRGAQVYRGEAKV